VIEYKINVDDDDNDDDNSFDILYVINL